MNKKHWSICKKCQGQGKIMQGPSKRVRRRYQRDLKNFELDNGIKPSEPKPHLDICPHCNASGLVQSDRLTSVDNNYPHVAIIGGGIGGTALAVACLHRGIPFTLYERDASFDERAQGYGLTLQQASKAIAGLGIDSLDEGIISTRHVVHNQNGKIIGEWGLRKWRGDNVPENSKRKNMHISRQSLRRQILDQLPENLNVKWDHKLINLSMNGDKKYQLEFETKSGIVNVSADLVVGADGIYGQTRKSLFFESDSDLKYLNCIVVLGICSLTQINSDSDVLDSKTVFQTVNGHERMYMMPYNENSIMWQFSYPLDEQQAIDLNKAGSHKLKELALVKVKNWHNPVSEIVLKTSKDKITGYPVYDREMLDQSKLLDFGSITLLGDAAHPMSPFKGQGANQAILDALNLARRIFIKCGPDSPWREIGLRNLVLNDFEDEMIKRTASKVKGSREAIELLHSRTVLYEGNHPRRLGG